MVYIDKIIVDVYILGRVILVNKLSRKGFTLVELLAVIVVLTLVIVIVATKGFGAFDNAKDKIDKMNENAIVEATEIIKLDIEHCDNTDTVLLTMFGATDCSDLYTKLEVGASISLEQMIEKNYISGADIEEIDKVKIYNINYKKEGNEIIIFTNIEEKKSLLANYFLSDLLSKFGKTKTDIVEIYFINKIDKEKTLKEVNINASQSNVKIYSWIEDLDGTTVLYIGSEGKIYAPINSRDMFNGYTNLKGIYFDNFDTSKVTSMAYMFSGCTSLEKLNLNNFNSKSLIDIYGMFCNSSSLKNIIFGSEFTVENTTNMYRMFEGCKSLEKLDLKYFKTNNVTNMTQMFYECDSLKELDLSNFNTEKVTKMNWMFSGCGTLTELNISNFETTSIKEMKYMFQSCSKLTYLDLSGFTTSSSTITTGMLNGTSKLNTVCVNQDKSSEIYNIVNSRGINIACN